LCDVWYVVFVWQPSAKFLLSYVSRCHHTTQLLETTAERHDLTWRTVCQCTHLTSSHHPHIVEFTLQRHVTWRDTRRQRRPVLRRHVLPTTTTTSHR